MTRDACGRWRSDGHVLLGALFSKLNARDLATECDVSESAVSLLRNGQTRFPDLHLANALKRRFGIPTEAWENEYRGVASNLSALKSNSVKTEWHFSEEEDDHGRSAETDTHASARTIAADDHAAPGESKQSV